MLPPAAIAACVTGGLAALCCGAPLAVRAFPHLSERFALFLRDAASLTGAIAPLS